MATMTMTTTTTTKLMIALVEKTGTIKSLTVKEYNEDELYKKCGFKKQDGFLKQTEWSLKFLGEKYKVVLYGKTEGKAGMENKYDFPPPVDNKLFFGTCSLVLKKKNQNNSNYEFDDLTRELWDKLYEKLFGGFEDLATTAKEDENEEDELDLVPASKKTKAGYLKDGFVLDGGSEDDDDDDEDDDDDDDDDDEEDDDEDEDDEENNVGDLEEDMELEELDELSSEEYVSEDEDEDDDDEDEDEDEDEDNDEDEDKDSKQDKTS